MNRGLGWRPDKPDARDHRFKASRALSLPHMVDLGRQMPPALDQGDTNSCVGHSIASLIEYTVRKMGLDNDGETDWNPSPLFIYTNARLLEDGLAEDGGAEIRDGIKGVVTWGVALAKDWPLVPAKLSVKPPLVVYGAAKKRVISRYEKVDRTLNAIKGCLAQANAIVFGMDVYAAFESDDVAKTGIVPMPKGTMEGGHAVCMVGYDDSAQSVIVRNSWGKGWGLPSYPGHFLLPYDYVISEHCSDFWTIQAVK